MRESPDIKGIGGGAVRAPKAARVRNTRGRTLRQLMDTLGIGVRAGKQPMRQGGGSAAAADCPPAKRGRKRTIEEYRLVCDQTNGEGSYDTLAPDVREVLHDEIDRAFAELEQDEAEEHREKQTKLAVGPSVPAEEPDEPILIILMAMDGVLLSTEPVGQTPDGEALSAAAYDYGVLRTLTPEQILRSMGNGDAEFGQVMVDVWFMTIRDLQSEGTHVCIIQDGAFEDIRAALEAVGPSAIVAEDYEEEEGCTLFDLFTTHPKGAAARATDTSHIYTNDPDPALRRYETSPPPDQDEDEWLRKGMFRPNLVAALLEATTRKEIMSPGIAWQGDDVWDANWSVHNMGFVGFYTRDLRGVGYENLPWAKVRASVEGADERSVPTLPPIKVNALLRMEVFARNGMTDNVKMAKRKAGITAADEAAWQADKARAKIPGFYNLLPAGQATRASPSYPWYNCWLMLRMAGMGPRADVFASVKAVQQLLDLHPEALAALTANEVGEDANTTLTAEASSGRSRGGDTGSAEGTYTGVEDAVDALEADEE